MSWSYERIEIPRTHLLFSRKLWRPLGYFSTLSLTKVYFPTPDLSWLRHCHVEFITVHIPHQSLGLCWGWATLYAVYPLMLWIKVAWTCLAVDLGQTSPYHGWGERQEDRWQGWQWEIPFWWLVWSCLPLAHFYIRVPVSTQLSGRWA